MRHVLCIINKHKWEKIEGYPGCFWEVRMAVYKCKRCNQLRMRIYNVDMPFIYVDRIATRKEINKQLKHWEKSKKDLSK